MQMPNRACCCMLEHRYPPNFAYLDLDKMGLPIGSEGNEVGAKPAVGAAVKMTSGRLTGSGPSAGGK
eukprot:scaffold172844_cov31-Tisochrysis_lutea.AAC.1